MSLIRQGFVFLSLILYGVLTPVCSQETDADQALVALFGDSISVGFQLGIFNPAPPPGLQNFGCPDIYLATILRRQDQRSASQRCPTVIHDSPVLDSNLVDGQTRDAQVVNWGVTGSNTVQGLARVTSNLNASRAQFPERDNRFVLIHYGTNDINDGISLQMTNFNLSQMVLRARQQAGFTPVISTILPRSDQSNVIDSLVFSINSQIRSIAATDANLVLVDLFNAFISYPGGWPSLIRLEDFSSVLPGGRMLRIHPNDLGYLFIAEQWFDQVLRQNIAPPPLPQEPSPSEPIIVPIIELLLNES